VRVAVVAAVAVVSDGRRTAGFLAAVSASLWFDFFLTKPYERFAITARPNIETALSLFVVGVVVTELAVRARQHQRVAEEESDYVGIIYYLAQLVVAGTSAAQVVERARSELTELLHLRACRFEDHPTTRAMTRIERVGPLGWAVHRMGLPARRSSSPVHGRGELLGRFVLVPTPGRPVSVQRRLVAVAIADQVGAALGAALRSA